MTPALHFKQFGRYEIIRKLGRSMTDVYLALDPEENRRVVLKIIEHSHDSYTQLITEAERRGAAIQKQLHALDPRILEIYDYGEQNGCFFVAMEYVEGKSLAEILRAERRLDPNRAARYAREVCSQLQTLHSFQADIDGRQRAVVHGDIKPSNIQITPHGDVRLLDFGIAKAITNTHNLTHHNLGSPAYCSPERVKSTQVDQHADLWAVGVTLYEMIAGLPPYQAQNTRKLENLIQSRRPPRALPADCPAGLKAVIAKALAADLSRRYATAASLESDLRLFLRDQPTAAETETAPAWQSNETLDKAEPRETKATPGAKPGPRIPITQLTVMATEFNRVGWPVFAGLVIGLLVFGPADHVYKLWTRSAPLRQPRNYASLPASQVEADWRQYEALADAKRVPAALTPAASVRQSLRGSFIATANSVIEQYRDSSDPDIAHFDWTKAQLCLKHALELQADNETRGKLALCAGYVMLPRDASAAKAAFEQAVAYAPRWPDPHLGLARMYIYSVHNIGRALAEFHDAERLGFRLGPRELEQQADGYLYRAEQALQRGRKATAPHEQAHYTALAQRDIERARNLYEPIAGFSNVTQNLQRLYGLADQEQKMAAAREVTKRRTVAKNGPSRYAKQRLWR